MFFAEEDLTLHITRGDAGEITVRAVDEKTDGSDAPYIFKAGEVLRLKVCEKKNCSVVVLQKDFPVVKDTETVTLALTEADTKIGDTISKPVDYWYEIELNPFTEPQTIVGYDDDGAKVLKLYPEGEDTEVIPPTPEELGTVDKELSLTSEKAIQNQAVTRAIVQLTARIDEVISDTDTSIDGYEELRDIRVGADGKRYSSAGTSVREQIGDLKEQQDKTREDVDALNEGGLNLKEDFIEGQINKWLDEHPEATTTVQDGSLEYQKLKAGTLGFVTPQMFGAKGDGYTDDTDAIQSALDFGAGVVYIPKGVYMVNGIESTNNASDLFACGLVVHSNTKLIMDKETVLELIPNGHTKSCVLRCDYSASNIEITGGQIYGDRVGHLATNGEHGMGIYVGGNDNVKISNCIIKNCWGDGIIVTLNDSFNLPSTNILIDNVVIDNARRNGISLVGVVGCTISNSTIRNTNGTAPQFAIDIEASPYEFNTNEEITIINCKIKGNVMSGVGSVANSKINATNIIIADCVFENNKEGITFGGISKVTIANSTFKTNTANGISLSGVADFTISNCLAYMNGNTTDAGNGLSLTGECSGIVEGCSFNQNKTHGINVNRCYKGVIFRSCIADGNGGSGFNVFTTTPPTTDEEKQAVYNKSIPIIISDCVCKNNTSCGMKLGHQPKFKVTNCSLIKNGAYGILLCIDADDSVVTDCYFEDNYVNGGNDLGCYNNSNSKIVNNTFRVGATAHTNAPMVIGYYNATTKNTFVAENDCRGMGANIKEMTSGVGIVTTGTIYGKNIKIDGTYE